MATAARTHAAAISSDATWQQFIQDIYDVLVGSGLVQTADTGQLANPVVATRPAAAYASSGYHIFRFNDALQGTHPLFLRVRYFMTAAAGTSPVVGVTVGKGTDGAGNLTGVIIGERHLSTYQPLGAGALCFGSHTADGTFTFVYNNPAAQGNNGCWFALDRLRDAAGAAEGGALFCAYRGATSNGGSTARGWVTVDYAAVLPSDANLTGTPALLPAQDATLFGSQVLAFPLHPLLGYGRPASLLGMVTRQTDVGPNITFQTSVYGATRTYRGVSAQDLTGRGSASGTWGFSLRYE